MSLTEFEHITEMDRRCLNFLYRLKRSTYETVIDDLFTMSEIIQYVANKGDDFLQIAFSFYFHNPIPIENLLILSHYFSMEIIR